MIEALFPFKLHLNILQLEEYKLSRLLKWIFANFFKRKGAGKKPLVWTWKVRMIFALSLFYLVLTVGASILIWGLLGVFIAAVFSSQTYLFITVATVTLWPYEKLNRYRTKSRVREKISRLKKNGLKVIGITGSYGKTSVKEFLYEMLKTKYRVLRTPESYNTLFGIVKVIDLELYEGYDFFICEMGAYTTGEIEEICDIVLPDHAILTGINEQHYERFGNIQNTVKAKFELVESVAKRGDGFVLLNSESELVVENYTKYKKDSILYGKKSNKFYLREIGQDKNRGSLSLVMDTDEVDAQTTLLGNGSFENILAAASMSHLLGVEAGNIASAINGLKPVPHRLEVKEFPNGLILIDDAYSSNVAGFVEALDVLGAFVNKRKVLVTPGIIELGNKTTEIHTRLGEYADKICDKILLVGQSERTEALYNSISNKSKVIFIKALNDMYNHLNDPGSTVVLLENDLPDNY